MAGSTCCSLIRCKGSYGALQLLLSVASHTVNLLSALPLQCLDVLLMVPLQLGSEQCRGVNMDCVRTLVLFMERRLESVGLRARANSFTPEALGTCLNMLEHAWCFQGEKMKEKLTPILNLLTESCRAHRETRRYIKNHVRPPPPPSLTSGPRKR